MPLPEFGRYGAVGFEFVASVGVGFFVGRAIDSHFETHGVAMWIGFFLGVLSGFLLLVRTARQLENDAAKDDDASSTPSRSSAVFSSTLNEGSKDGQMLEKPTADPLQRRLEDVETKIADDEKKNRS
jgi:Putative F0F1-ATPase subunit Ca2+/Mg2+ transporter